MLRDPGWAARASGTDVDRMLRDPGRGTGRPQEGQNLAPGRREARQ
jgi:hypothetical protein